MKVSRVKESSCLYIVSMNIRAPEGVKEKDLKLAILNALEKAPVIKKKKNGQVVDLSDQVCVEDLEIEEDMFLEGVDEEIHEYEYEDED